MMINGVKNVRAFNAHIRKLCARPRKCAHRPQSGQLIMNYICAPNARRLFNPFIIAIKIMSTYILEECIDKSPGI